MSLGVFSVAALVFAAGPPTDVISISARLEAGKLEVGQNYELSVDVKVKDGWSASQAGIPKPMVQIKFPDCAKTRDHVLSDYRELSRNEFLQKPYEQLASKTLRYEFALTRAPRADEHFALNVLAYVSDDAAGAWFVRRRYEIPLSAGAVAEQVAAADSSWGAGGVLQIGDRAAPFELPRADASTVSLEYLLGKSNIIVTTYRAFW